MDPKRTTTVSPITDEEEALFTTIAASLIEQGRAGHVMNLANGACDCTECIQKQPLSLGLQGVVSAAVISDDLLEGDRRFRARLAISASVDLLAAVTINADFNPGIVIRDFLTAYASMSAAAPSR